MQFEQLRALVSVVDNGTFEAAARELSVTPSAVSQRIKALEGSAGQVLVRREVPVVPTVAGEHVLRMARQMVILESETRRELGIDEPRTILPVAVNADSLATWLRELLPVAASWTDISLHLHVEDQEHTLARLRSGAAVGAITSDPGVVPGCRSQPLGRIRYLPVATRTLADEHRRGNSYDWQSMPMLSFNADDRLQERFLSRRDPEARPPVTLIPDSTVFAEAVHEGLGWGMLPEAHLDDGLESGHLVRVHASHHDLDLFWQTWRLRSEPLERLTKAVLAAAAGLRPPARSRK